MTTKNKSQVRIQSPPEVDPSSATDVSKSINEHFVSIGSEINPLKVEELPAFLPAQDPVPEIFPWDVYEKLKGVLHPRPVFGLFLHFSQKLQHIGNK